MFNKREKIEILVATILLVFGSPIAAYFGHFAGIERGQELWGKKPAVIQELLLNEQATQDSLAQAQKATSQSDSTQK